jgi:hypothetical protein
MIRLSCCAVCLVLFICETGLAQMSPGAAPSIVLGSVYKTVDGLQMVLGLHVYHDREIVVEVEREGRKLRESRTVSVASFEDVAFAVDKDVQVLDLKGKPVDEQTLIKRLAKRTPILLANRPKVSPEFLRIIKDSALIVVIDGARLYELMHP